VRRKGIYLALGTIAVLGALAEARAEDFRVEATVDAAKVGMDDQLQLTVTLHGDTLGRASLPRLPKIEGFRLAHQSQSTSFQIVNGQMSSTRAYIYTLLPQSEGKHLIDAVSVTYGGQEYLTQPIEVEVVSGSVRASTGRPGNDPFSDPFAFPFRRRQRSRAAEGEVFVAAELSRPSVYVGQQVLLTYKLYTQVPITGLEFEKQPQVTGAWVEPVPLERPDELGVETVEGKDFTVFGVKKSYLFPTQAGKLSIEPAVVAMAIRASTDPFDSLFFQSSETIRRSTKPLTLEVKPLPAAGRPADFSGAVGEFRLEAKLDKEQVSAGDPLTLSVSLQGKGNLKTAAPPALPPLTDFKVYEPKVQESFRTEAAGFSGQKKWEYVLVPNSVGQQRLAPVRFSYFDAARERYVQVETEPLALTVNRPAAVTGLPLPQPRGEVKLLRRDIRYLKPRPARLGAPGTPYHRSYFFFASLGLPLIWNLALVGYLRRRRGEESDSAVWRSRRARKMAQKRLKLAARKARAGSRDFFEVAATALYGYLADKLQVSASGLTRAQVDSLLSERAVPEAARSELFETLEALEFARFTPGERSPAEMESLLARASEALVSLEKELG
jgi:hypothetical protein